MRRGLELALAIALFSCSGTVALEAAQVLSWRNLPGYRAAELPVSLAGKTGFTQLLSAQTGLTFSNRLADARAEQNRILENGSGVAAGDVDGDGWCDLYFCGLDGPNVLYRNLGNWKFEDVTTAAGVACEGQFSTGAVVADVDGDGALDLLVNALGRGTRLFLNDGRAHFTESLSSGLHRDSGSTSMALADIDGDNDLDLYVANYRSTTLLDSPPDAKYEIKVVGGKRVVVPEDRFVITGQGPQLGIAEKGEADVLYLNDSHGHFTPVSWTAGAFLDESGKPLTAPPQGWGLSVMFRDLNGDGAPDLYVCNDFAYRADDVWLNDSRGHFRTLPKLALRASSWSSMAVDFADLNRDGWDDFIVLDMLSREHPRRQRQRANPDLPPLPHFVGEIENRPQVMRNTLFLNRGDGTYAEIAQLSGVEASEWAWSVAFLDVDLDGFEDLLMTTGNLHDVLDADTARKNQAIRAASKTKPSQTLLNFPMLETPKLAFRNRGDLTFEEVGLAWGFGTVGISHGLALADLDNDGDLDLVVNNLRAAAGVYRNDTPAPRVAVRLKGGAPNHQGIGAKIKVLGAPVPQSQEIICGGRYLSGDDAVRVFAAGALTNVLRIEVTWRSGERSVVQGAKANQMYEINEGESSVVSDQSSLAKDDERAPTEHGPRTTDQQAVQSSKFKVQSDQPSVGLGQLSVANDGEAASRLPRITDRVSRPTPPFFHDASHLLKHVHHEEPFVRHGPQPLLPNRLTELGPGVAWFDLDGDGWDDLIVGSGKGGGPAVYRNNRHSGFETMKSAALKEPAGDDLTGVVGWTSAPGRRSLLFGVSNYESGLSNAPAVMRYDFTGPGFLRSDPFATPRPALGTPQPEGVGPLALADIDNDGDLDVFVGGRFIPGQYPAPSSSRLFRNVGGQLQLDAENSRELAGCGLVSGAVFSDLDGDGFPDLVLACEWGPLRIYRNSKGTLAGWNPTLLWPDSPNLNSENTPLPGQRPLSPRRTGRGQGEGRSSDFPDPIEKGRHDDYSELSTVNSLRGWWTGVTTGDFDGDGQLDIVATNWGRNTKYQRYRAGPLRMFYGDFNGDGSVENIEAYFDPTLNKVVPWRDFASAAQEFPWINMKFSSYTGYSTASVEEILGERFASAAELQANWLESTVFLNRGKGFEVRLLPVEAQFAPAFGVCVADFDGDGLEDIFLSQNFFATQPETSRYDAGRGLWLRGDGENGFQTIGGQESGVLVYGEQRGAAVADFDADARVDLVVTQNGAATKLYRNRRAKPGLRIRLQGSSGNPLAVGASVRLKFRERFGPLREIHAGSGYWSQDSAVLVMASSESPVGVWVRWPGGAVVTAEVPSRANELILDPAGKVTLVK